MAQEKGKVGSLFFGMTLDSNPFQKNLKKAQKQLKQAGKDMRESFAKIAKGGLAVGAAFVGAGTGLLFFAKNTAEATNEQLILADSIGATQEQIAGLDLAAQKLGVDQGMLIDKMREFGGIDEFKRLADQVKGAGDEQAQLNKALEIFGGEGAKILPVLQQGAAGLANMEAEARRLGLALSPEQIEKSRVAWSAYEKTLLSLKGLGKQIGTALLEPFAVASTVLGSFIDTFRDDILKGFNFISNIINKTLRKAFDLFVEYGIPAVNSVIIFAEELGNTFADVFNFMDEEGGSTFDTIGSFFTGMFKFLATFKQTFIATITGAVGAVLRFTFNGLSKLSRSLGDNVITLVSGLEEAGLVSEGFTSAVGEAFGEQSARLRGMGRDLAKPFKDAREEALKEETKILDRLAKKNEKDRKVFSKGMRVLDANLAKTTKETAKAAANVSKEIKAERSEKRTGAIVSGSAEEARILNAQNDKNLQIQQKQLKAQQSMATGLNRLSVI
jgi:hypothetical protein